MLNRTMTPARSPTTLRGEPTTGGTGVPVVLREGLRLEQIVAYLQTLPLENLDSEEFYTSPPSRQQHSARQVPLAERHPTGPQRRGLPRVGRVRRRRQISTHGRWSTAPAALGGQPRHRADRAGPGGGKDFYTAVILASIVEREAILD